jgi:hypothetical protein
VKWIFRFVVLVIVIYGGQTAFRQISLAHERYELRKQVQAQIEALPAAQQRAAALGFYLGFYWAGSNLLPAVCKKEGIDLSDYQRAHADRYAAEHDRVRAAYRSVGGSEQAVISAVSAGSSDVFKKALLRATDMSHSGDSMADGCRAILKKQDKVLDRMNFAEAFPYVWSVADVR